MTAIEPYLIEQADRLEVHYTPTVSIEQSSSRQGRGCKATGVNRGVLRFSRHVCEVQRFDQCCWSPRKLADSIMALVKLSEGPMVTAQLTDVHAEQVKIGMPVEMVTRKLTQDGDEGQILYGYKFRPLLQ